MKKLLLGFATLLLNYSGTISAQITNGDFSNWALDSLNYWDPVNWESTNTYDSGSGGSVLRDIDRQGGSGYSVKLAAVYDSILGFWIGGEINLRHAPFTNSIRPSTLSGYFKINNIHLGDQIGFKVNLFNSLNIKIGSANYGSALGATYPNWSAFSATINYTTNDPVAFYDIDAYYVALTNDTAVHCHLDDLDFDVSTNNIPNLDANSFCSIKRLNDEYILDFDSKTSNKFSVNVFDINSRELLNVFEGFATVGKIQLNSI